MGLLRAPNGLSPTCAMRLLSEDQRPSYRILIFMSTTPTEKAWLELVERKRQDHGDEIEIDVLDESDFRKRIWRGDKPSRERTIDLDLTRIVKAHKRVKAFVESISHQFSSKAPLLKLIWTLCFAAAQASFKTNVTLKNLASCIKSLDERIPAVEVKHDQLSTVQEPLRSVFATYIEAYLRIIANLKGRYGEAMEAEPDILENFDDAALRFTNFYKEYHVRVKLATEMAIEIPTHQSKSQDYPKFERGDLIGEGSFAKVYKVKEKTTKIVYAMKSLRYSSGDDSQNTTAEEQILKEIGIMQQLRHHHIVTLAFALKASMRWTYELYMQPAAEDNLEDFLRRKDPGVQDNTKVFSWFGCLASALDYAHRNNIRHKDIKPKNVLVVDDGKSVMLCDFGLAQHFSNRDAAASRGSRPSGTPEYWAPECEDPYADRDFPADIFSLGAVYCQLINSLGGKSVDDFKKVRLEWNDGVSSAFCHSVKKMKLESWLWAQRSETCRDDDQHKEEKHGTEDHLPPCVVAFTVDMIVERPHLRPKASKVYRRFRQESDDGHCTRFFCTMCEGRP